MTSIDENAEKAGSMGDNQSSIDLERYRIRFGFLKVLFGTAIVGLAGVLVPGAVEFWQAYFDDRRKTLELELTQIVTVHGV